MIKRILSTGTSDRIYYRYVCEKCGYNSHWIDYQVVSGFSAAAHSGDANAVAAKLSSDSQRYLDAKMDGLENEIKECLNGKQAASRDDYSIYHVFKLAEKCPKCGHIPSWLPVQKLFRKNAGKYNAATPVVSEPDVIFGGKKPADVCDFDDPCHIEITGNTVTFGAATASFFLNGIYLGEYRNGTNFYAETRFADNLISVRDSAGGAILLTFYFPAQSGETVRYQFTGRAFKQL